MYKYIHHSICVLFFCGDAPKLVNIFYLPGGQELEVESFCLSFFPVLYRKLSLVDCCTQHLIHLNTGIQKNT